LVRLSAGAEVTPEAQQCQLWIALEGRGQIGSEPFRAGDVLLLPETGRQPAVRAGEDARFLRTYVPDLRAA
jgi:hypothetical protein